MSLSGEVDIEKARFRMDALYEHASPASAVLLDTYRDREPLGMGWEKVVYPMGEDKVIAFMSPDPDAGRQITSSPEQNRDRFYALKLVRALLPNNIPDVRCVGLRPGIMVSERVFPALEPTNFFARRRQERLRKDTYNTLYDRSLELVLQLDYGMDNFIFDRDGNYKYIDTVGLGPRPESYLPPAVAELSGQSRIDATRWLIKLGLTPTS